MRSHPAISANAVGPPNLVIRIGASFAARISAVVCSAQAPLLQQPRQIDSIILSTLASSRSMAGLVPSSGPFMGPWPTPDDESAVPSELVPGAAALLPKAPPIADIPCDPMPPPRANAAVAERPMQSTM